MFGQLHTQEYKATKKQIVRLQLNEKKSKESQIRLMSWCWKLKPTWRKDLISYNSHPWIMCVLFSLFVYHLERGVVWNWTPKIKGVGECWSQMDKRVGGLENWTIFMDVICLSSLKLPSHQTLELVLYDSW